MFSLISKNTQNLKACFFSGLCLTTALSFAQADTVAEWKFAPVSDIMGGGTVKLDKAAAGASDVSELSPTARVFTGSTGISSKWEWFLCNGYLDADSGGSIPGTGIVNRNQHGLFTVPSSPETKNGFYSDYFGFSGLGFGTLADDTVEGGTVYMVFSPQSGFNPGARYGFFGTGHTGEGEIGVAIDKNGDLYIRVGGKSSARVSSKLTPNFVPGSWYLLAASWTTGKEPVIYLRELSPDGPKASPAALVGTATGIGPDCKRPDKSPLAIGADWFDPGANASTVYGAGSKIAYVLIENRYVTKNHMDEVFDSLGAN